MGQSKPPRRVWRQTPVYVGEDSLITPFGWTVVLWSRVEVGQWQGGTQLAITIEVRDGIVHISFPLDNDEGLSASKKTRIVASTHGNQEIGDTGVILGLNAYRPVPRRKR